MIVSNFCTDEIISEGLSYYCSIQVTRNLHLQIKAVKIVHLLTTSQKDILNLADEFISTEDDDNNNNIFRVSIFSQLWNFSSPFGKLCLSFVSAE